MHIAFSSRERRTGSRGGVGEQKEEAVTGEEVGGAGEGGGRRGKGKVGVGEDN